MAPSWVIPVASLSAICGIAFIFVWWWYVFEHTPRVSRILNTIRFPRMWKKGTQEEMELARRERAERERYMQQRNLEAGITPEVKQAVASTEEKDAPPASAQEKDTPPASAKEKQSSTVTTPE